VLVVGDNSYRPLQSLQWRAQGTASKRALLIGSPHSSQIPNLSCRIRVKVSSMARKSLLSACLKRTWTEALISLAAISTGSPPRSPPAGIEPPKLLLAETSCCFSRRRFL